MKKLEELVKSRKFRLGTSWSLMFIGLGISILMKSIGIDIAISKTVLIIFVISGMFWLQYCWYLILRNH